MALPEDMLAVARHLALREPKRPRQATLRRAISTAYYAVFHLLASAGAGALAPARPAALRARVRRAFVHEEMKQICLQFRHGNVASLSTATRPLITGALEQELATVATAFLTLQQVRHAADYDAVQTFARADVLQTVNEAETAFAAWKAVKGRPNANVFLAALLLGRGWRAGWAQALWRQCVSRIIATHSVPTTAPATSTLNAVL